MTKTINERMTVELEGNLVVFIIGMKINLLWKLHKWLPIASAMPKMLKELSAKPESGFLGFQMLGGIPLGTGGVENQPTPETWFRQWGDPMARNISTATLTPFLPEPGTANGATVIVAPGGGFSWLSMGNEGCEVAEALAKKGITAFVLKYRLNPTPESLEDFTAWTNRPRTPAPPL